MSNTCKEKNIVKDSHPKRIFKIHNSFIFFVEPFTNLVTHHFNNVYPDHKSLGLTLSTDQGSNQAYKSELEAAHTKSMSKTIKVSIKGAYVSRIDNAPIFTKTEAKSALKALRENQVSTFSIVLAPKQ